MTKDEFTLDWATTFEDLKYKSAKRGGNDTEFGTCLKCLRKTKKNFLRILKMFAIHEKHLTDLFRQTFGMKNYDFDVIMKEIAEDFGVTFEELDNTKFARFEIE